MFEVQRDAPEVPVREGGWHTQLVSTLKILLCYVQNRLGLEKRQNSKKIRGQLQKSGREGPGDLEEEDGYVNRSGKTEERCGCRNGHLVVDWM